MLINLFWAWKVNFSGPEWAPKWISRIWLTNNLCRGRMVHAHMFAPCLAWLQADPQFFSELGNITLVGRNGTKINFQNLAIQKPEPWHVGASSFVCALFGAAPIFTSRLPEEPVCSKESHFGDSYKKYWNALTRNICSTAKTPDLLCLTASAFHFGQSSLTKSVRNIT